MKRRVLIAEDEESIVASLDFLMRQCGFDTRIARDGERAIASLGEYRPDLVLLDLMLPRASGLEVCRAIRADASLGATRVLMLTAKGGEHDEVQHLALALRELLQAFAHRPAARPAAALDAVALEAFAHELDHALVVEGLLEEIHRPLAYRAHRLRHVGPAREEDHRDQHALGLEVLLQLEAVHAGQMQVQHQASRLVGRVGREEFARIGERAHR